MIKRIGIILLLTACIILNNFAQRPFTLKITEVSNNYTYFKSLKYKSVFGKKEDLYKELNNILRFVYEDGYLAARFDSVITDSFKINAQLWLGKQYKWAFIKKGNLSVDVIREIKLKEKTFKSKPISFVRVNSILNKVINYYENRGYPFASVKLDSLKFNDNIVTASIIVDKNILIYIDSITVDGDAKSNSRFLSNYLEIKPNSIYNEALINKISKKLRDLPFLTETKPHDLFFFGENVKVIIHVNRKKASQFDGVLGFAPSAKNRDNFDIIGELNLNLINSFSAGEQIGFNFKKLPDNTQDAKINFNYPYLLNSPFGIDLKFSLYRKDTTYINLSQSAGIQYSLTGTDYAKVYIDNRSSSLINTKGFRNATVLPPFADIEMLLYGFEFKSENLDYRFNPKKGYRLKMSTSLGIKNIKKNDSINPIVYDSIKLKSTQYNFDFYGDYFVPVSTMSTFRFNITGGMIKNENIFENELYRIGGLKTLRGFDEESIHASIYSIFVLEYRFIFEQNSFLSLFYNYAYYEKKIPNKFICDRPYGYGAGISFETKAGIFSLMYALGKELGKDIEFKNSKIHFGITTIFN